MKELRFSLVTDGSSDVALLPILRWLLRQHLPEYALQETWADVRSFGLHRLEDKIAKAIDFYPCDLLFVHRDAEREAKERRFAEVHQALDRAKPPVGIPVVCVVPVRMQEAWLLFDEGAIRQAAGNQNGRVSLSLPSLRRIEERPDPKEDLYALLRLASELHGRRLKSFPESQHARRVADYIEDYSPLRSLTAFAVLEEHLVYTLKSYGWLL